MSLLQFHSDTLQAVTYHVLEHGPFFDIAHWNGMAWGNIGATVRATRPLMGYTN